MNRKNHSAVGETGQITSKAIRCALAIAACIQAGLFSPAVLAQNVKTETIEYHDDASKWVLGQVKRTTVNGVETVRTEFTANTQPARIYAFGKPQQTLTYNADGTLATVADGNNNVITLSGWKRGIPQLIHHPATPEAPSGATESATVDDNGWITSVTNEAGAKTCYSYDAMGRVRDVVHPSETTPGVCDESKWNASHTEFRPLVASDWIPSGIAVGQWRQLTWRGSYVKATYFDAMWRPTLSLEYDNLNAGPTMRSTRTAYDTSGRVSFQSYPIAGAEPSSTGTRTFYDALDRVTRVEQDSELGVLTSTTEYLPGFQTRTTNPRGLQTTTQYQAFDTPTYAFPTGITTSADTATEIHRDVFGKPLAIVRRNHANTERLVRSYVYDGHQQLCKAVEPETGATVMDYDAAGNLQWTASGLGLTSTADCDTLAARDSGRKVTRLYDARNRLTSLQFPDGRGNQDWTYTPDGLPAQVATYGFAGGTPATNAYSYNARRLLVGESLTTWPGAEPLSLGYGYDANGHLSVQTYPTGLAVDFAPNALGQPTQAGPFANNVSYYPNGAIKNFAYGNGVAHWMSQNARQLPAEVSNSGGVLGFSYRYDQNGNVNHIWDHARDSGDGFYGRWMEYDGLDRLTAAGSCSFGGDCWHRFTYDALDNLKSWKLGGIKDYANYYYEPGTNRLTNIQDSAGATVVGLGYDAQGNLANKNGIAHTFDYGNRLRAHGDTSYRYDAYGRRHGETSGFENPRSRTWMYSQAGQLMFENDGGSHSRTDHIYLGGSLIAKRTLSMHAWPPGTATVRYQHTDALGSPVAVTDEAGMVIDRTAWEPFGAAIGKPTYQGVGYTGHMMDSGSGLVYMQQRYYDPQIGRFLSVDPVTANTTNGSNFNRYWYAFNNPYKFFDPDGRFGCTGSRIKSTCDSMGMTWTSARSSMDIGRNAQSGSPSPTLSNSPANAQSRGSNSPGQSASLAAKTLADANGMIAGTKQNSLVTGGAWRGANGKMYDLGWGGNQHTGARSAVLQEANAFRAAGQGFFLFSSGISLYEGAGALQRGDSFGVAKAGVDIGWGAAGTFGGPVGLVGGATYSGTSFLVTIPAIRQYTVEPVTDGMCWASGNC